MKKKITVSFPVRSLQFVELLDKEHLNHFQNIVSWLESGDKADESKHSIDRVVKEYIIGNYDRRVQSLYIMYMLQDKINQFLILLEREE